MEEITLLDALQQLWHHKAKRKNLFFEVTFDEGITRKAYFGKSWSRVMGDWQYIVQDGEHALGQINVVVFLPTAQDLTGIQGDLHGLGLLSFGVCPLVFLHDPRMGLLVHDARGIQALPPLEGADRRGGLGAVDAVGHHIDLIRLDGCNGPEHGLQTPDGLVNKGFRWLHRTTS